MLSAIPRENNKRSKYVAEMSVSKDGVGSYTLVNTEKSHRIEVCYHFNLNAKPNTSPFNTDLTQADAEDKFQNDVKKITGQTFDF